MAHTPINTGTAPNDGTGDTIRDAFEIVNNNFGAPTITGDVAGTVAADGDPAGVDTWDSFDEAMTWAAAQNSGDYTITLVLNIGTHTLEADSKYVLSNIDIEIVTSDIWAFDNPEVRINASSASSGDPLITCDENSTVYIQQVNFNETAGGYSYPNTYDCIRVKRGGRLTLYEVHMYYFDKQLYIEDGGYVYLRAYFNDAYMHNGNTAIYATGKDAYLYSPAAGTYVNVDAPINAYLGAQLRFLGSMYTSSTTNVTINEIQSDNTLIADANYGYITHAGSLSPPLTNLTQKTVGVNKDFATLDEAMTWVSQQLLIYLGRIRLLLTQGEVYEINNTSYHVKNVDLEIVVPYGTKAIITNKSTAFATARDLFTVYNNASLRLERVEYDPKYSGWGPTTYNTCVLTEPGARVVFDETNVKNCYTVIESHDSKIVFESTNNFTSNIYGLTLYDESDMRINGGVTTISSSSNDIFFHPSTARGDNKVVALDTNYLVYTTSNITENVIQTNGNYIQRGNSLF